MVTISWPSNTKDTIDAIREAIGRNTTWTVVASSVACSGCALDPITNTSANSFCTICDGLHWIPVYSGATVKAHVTWGHSELLNWVPGGQLFEGDCRLSIEYSTDNIYLVENAIKVEVDGKDMQVFKKTLRGVPQINRILVDLIERNKEA